MRFSNQKGFTIIEVILFLALSSLFLAVAFVGIRGRTANVQFTDSMRSLQSFLVSEQNKVLNGVNSSATAPSGCGNAGSATGESNECILIGRVVSFGKNASNLSDVSINVLYGSKPTSSALSTEDDDTLINKSTPRTDATTGSYSISWGTDFILTKSFNAGVAGNYDRIGWLRSPSSTRIIPIAYQAGVLDLDGDYYRQSAAESSMGNEVNVRLCFIRNDNSKVASITFGNGLGGSSIELLFDDEKCL